MLEQEEEEEIVNIPIKLTQIQIEEIIEAENSEGHYSSSFTQRNLSGSKLSPLDQASSTLANALHAPILSEELHGMKIEEEEKDLEISSPLSFFR